MTTDQTAADPRTAVLSAMAYPPYNETAEERCTPWAEAERLLDAYRDAVLAAVSAPVQPSRADVLREAVGRLEGVVRAWQSEQRWRDGKGDSRGPGVLHAIEHLRRMAVEEQPATEADEPCTCADAGDCFAPAGHYADCPAAGPRDPS